MGFAQKYKKTVKELQVEKVYDNSKPATDKKGYERIATWTTEAWGNHVLEIQEVRLFSMGQTIFEKEDGTPVIADADKIAVDLVVVESDTLDVGTEMVWADNARNYPKSFAKNCMSFVSAALKAPFSELNPEDVEIVAAEDQPLKGGTVSARIEQFVSFKDGSKPLNSKGEPRTRCTFNAHFPAE